MLHALKATLLAGLLAVSPAAAQEPAAAPSTPAPAAPTTEQPTILVTSVVPGYKAADGNYMGAVVQFDLVNADLQRSLVGKSTRLVIDIDCAGEKIRARNMIVYKEPRQGGAATEVRIKDDWESYHGGAYLADVARSICHQEGGGMPAAVQAPPPPPLLARSPMPPARRDSASARADASPRLIQFVSSASEAEVRDDIARLRSKLGAQIGQMQFSVQTAVVKGVKRYRGRLGLFSSSVEAEQFCSKIIELNFQCLLTRDTK